MRGPLEKRSSDGSWKIQLFSLHKHKLYYQDSLDRDRIVPRASMDLLDVVKLERVGNKLYLWVDERRKHQLREPRVVDASSPTLEEWERAIHERVAIARTKRRKRLAPTAEMPAEDAPAYADRIDEEKRPDDEEGEEDQRQREREYYRGKIREFYEKHNKDKVDDVDALIIKYLNVGISEKDLLTAIQNKYEKIRCYK